MSDQRNSTLDLFKLLASYMVLLVHIRFPGNIGLVFDALGRYTVPFFLLASGFYSYNISTNRIKKRISNVIFLMVFAGISYTLFNLSKEFMNYGLAGIAEYFQKFLDPVIIFRFFVFNSPAHTIYLWYLHALLYVYIIFYYITKHNVSERVIYGVSVLFLLLHLFLGEFLLCINVLAIPAYYVRNFALMGIPFFAFGMLTKKYSSNLAKIPDYVMLLSLLVGIVASVFSRFYNGKNELFLGSLFILFAFVICFVKYPNIKCPPVFLRLAGCSTYIYIFHPIVSSVIMKILSFFAADISASYSYLMVHPLIVCVATSIFAYIVDIVMKKLRI